MRQGTIDNPPKLPVIMGFECAGEVEALGEGVADFQVTCHFYLLTSLTFKAVLYCALDFFFALYSDFNCILL